MRRVKMPAISAESGGPARAEPSLALEAFLPYRLNVLASVVSNALARIYETRFQLTIPAWRVMATLGQFGERTARDIVAHGVMHKSTVSRAVADLVARDLVARRPNPDDLREEMLALTPRGEAIYRELAPQALAFESELASALSKAEQSQFLALVARLEARARAITEPPAAAAE